MGGVTLFDPQLKTINESKWKLFQVPLIFFPFTIPVQGVVIAPVLVRKCTVL